MAEADTSLTQRVESLERTSHERVVEQVADLGERVAGLESARDAENPHLATKADIARLETQNEHTQEQISRLDEKIDQQSTNFDAKLEALTKHFDAKLEAQSKHFDAKLEAQSKHFDTKLEALTKHFDAKLEAQSKNFDSRMENLSERLDKKIEQRINRNTAWIIATVLGVAALILSRLPG